jgi:hypothetical protein
MQYTVASASPIGEARRDPLLLRRFLQLRAGRLCWTSPEGNLLAHRSTAFPAGELALALAMEASFISIDG